MSFPHSGRGIGAGWLLAAAMTSAGAAGETEALWSQIQQEIGQPVCTGNSVCRSIGIGSKACGGPSSYVAWSSAVSDEKRLRQLVEAHADAQQRVLRERGAISNCMMQVDPGAVCSAGRCVLSTERTPAPR